MRDPRPGIAWSTGRIVRRAGYAAYMASERWCQVREAWAAQWFEDHGRPPVCSACGAEWRLRAGDLHHRSYSRLGHEKPNDMIPMCRGCHADLHRILESSPAWRRLGRPQATDLIVNVLRKRHLQQEGPT